MKKIFFLLLAPFLLLANDIKFAIAGSLGEKAKEYAVKVADIIDEELNIKLVRNFESRIYEDEAALYAVKNGLIKFSMVRSDLFAELGLKRDEEYGYETIESKEGFVIVIQSRFWNSLAKNKRDALIKRIKKLKK